MFIQVLILIGGLALIIFGAEYLVNGSSSIARRAGISEFVIGLTIVGMGTSTPEMVVSFMGALGGNADIAIGNVVGSNIFNVLLILGITAMILPMNITKSNIKQDIPINLAVTALLIILGLNATIFGMGENKLSRVDGAIFLLLFIGYIIFSFKNNKAEENESNDKVYSIPVSIIMVAGGLAALIFGGRLFVDSATLIAKMAGVSDKFIAITLLAGGTSAPELATCIIAAMKKKGQLALGNIIGSNIFNILLILGGSALIQPLNFNSMDYVDLGVVFLSTLLVLVSAYTGEKNKLDRKDAVIFLGVEIAYTIYLFIHA